MKKEEGNRNKTDKKAQFYLLAAILIIVAVSGIIGMKNYAVVKQEPTRLHDLGSELKEESLRIVDYGIFNKPEKIDDFINISFPQYFLKSAPDTDIAFVYGDKTDIKIATYVKETPGHVFANIGGLEIPWQASVFNNVKRIENPLSANVNDAVTIEVLGKDYDFTVRDNEMFYFIIVQEKEGERYVEKFD